MKRNEIKVGQNYRVRVFGGRSSYQWVVARVLETGVERSRSAHAYWRPGQKALFDGVRCVVVLDPAAEGLRGYWGGKGAHQNGREFVVRTADVIEEADPAIAALQAAKADADDRARLHDAWVEAEVKPKNQAVYAAIQALVDERFADVPEGERPTIVRMSYDGESLHVYSLNVFTLAKLLGLDVESAESFSDWKVGR